MTPDDVLVNEKVLEKAYSTYKSMVSNYRSNTYVRDRYRGSKTQIVNITTEHGRLTFDTVVLIEALDKQILLNEIWFGTYSENVSLKLSKVEAERDELIKKLQAIQPA